MLKWPDLRLTLTRRPPDPGNAALIMRNCHFCIFGRIRYCIGVKQVPRACPSRCLTVVTSYSHFWRLPTNPGNQHLPLVAVPFAQQICVLSERSHCPDTASGVHLKAVKQFGVEQLIFKVTSTLRVQSSLASSTPAILTPRLARHLSTTTASGAPSLGCSRKTGT